MDADSIPLHRRAIDRVNFDTVKYSENGSGFYCVLK